MPTKIASVWPLGREPADAANRFAADPQPTDPEGILPSVLTSRYSTSELLGSGAHTRVVRAFDNVLEREVAIKLFDPSDSSPAVVRGHAREGRLLASLNHRALTTLFDSGAVETGSGRTQAYLVMEFIPGLDLAARIKRGPMDWLQVCWLGHDLCDALDYLHEAGFLHRDIKPANVLVADRRADTRLRGKLTDVGISSLITAPHESGMLTGTAAYVAPEQAENFPSTPASDVYSLGLVLLEALTSKRAYPGHPDDVAFDRLDRQPTIPTTLPSLLADLLTAMTARDPNVRPGAQEASDRFRDLAISERIRRGPAPQTPATDETSRLRAVQRYSIIDTPREDSFDDLTAMAARVLHAPIAMVSIIDTDRVWFKSRHDFDEPELDRNTAFCTLADPGVGPWTIPDTTADPRTRTNRLVIDEPYLRAYAAAPLRSHDGHHIGTLCVCDRQPHDFTDEDLMNLQTLADVVMRELELRLASRRIVFNRTIQA